MKKMPVPRFFASVSRTTVIFCGFSRKKEPVRIKHTGSADCKPKARALVRLMKVFARLFQKAVQSRAHSPCRRPQAAKSPYGAFFLPSFFFAPASSKKKRVEVLCTFTVVVSFVDIQRMGSCT
ncbi:MAG: hypothetical protein MR379_08105 [Clostridiales bacterium]|nr:hypothetical protein [Clostridiales bacterium]